MTEQAQPEDKILRRIQGLLAQADHPNTDPVEAAVFRNKAEALMWKYRIDEAMAAQVSGAPALLPQWETILICDSWNEFRNYYMSLFTTVANHVGVRFHLAYEYDDAGASNLVAKVCGYPSDLHIVQGLFVSCLIAFSTKVEPKYDPDLSDQVNAYNMRSAGMEGRRIAQAIYGRDDKSLRPKVRAMFKKEAEARGEDPAPLLGRGSNMKEYRINYATAFVSAIATRLRVMREARGEVSGEIVLASHKENIDEAFYERYPNYRPQPKSTKRLPGLGDTRDNCAKCKAAKSGYCREHQWMKPKASRGGTRYNSAAQERGRSAARSADIGVNPGNKISGMKEIG